MSRMERQLMHLLRQATMAMRAEFRQSLVDLDLTPVQNTVLHLVAATPGSSSAELARRAFVSPQTMHKLVAELEHRGLLALHPRPGHGRILDSELTDQGRQLLTGADARAQTIEDRMTAGLDRQQRQQLLDLLQHCVTALES
jgi:DNA-binding MarR family transcriptional regulator